MERTARDRRSAWIVAVVSMLLAAPILTLSFTVDDDAGFVVSLLALGLAAVWLAGGLAVLRILRAGDAAQAIRRPLDRRGAGVVAVTAVGFATASLGGGLVLAWWPPTAPLVAGPLGAASSQSPLVLLAVALVAGAAEEVFFRLAFPLLLRGRARWIVPLALYGAVTLCSGSPALALMAVLLGAVAMWTLERTGSWIAPIAVHAAWTLAMIGLFPLLAP